MVQGDWTKEEAKEIEKKVAGDDSLSLGLYVKAEVKGGDPKEGHEVEAIASLIVTFTSLSTTGVMSARCT